MPRRLPRRTEKANAPGRCSCEGGHIDGLARSTRKNAGAEYLTEPAAPTAHHFSGCPHSQLEETTRVRGYEPPKRRPPRALTRRIV